MIYNMLILQFIYYEWVDALKKLSPAEIKAVVYQQSV